MRIVRPPPVALTREIECAQCAALVECARHELAWTTAPDEVPVVRRGYVRADDAV